MRKIRLSFVLSLVMLFMFSCSMEITQEKIEDTPVIEEAENINKDCRDVKINISSNTLSSRTILPDSNSLIRANWYEVTLTSVSDPNLTYTESISTENGGDAVVSIKNVKIGTYRVSGEAYIKNGDASKVLVYKGEGTQNLNVEIDGSNTTSIVLKALCEGEGLTGSISITIDWTEAAKMEGVVKEVVEKYPLSIKFFYADDYSANDYSPVYSQLGETLTAEVGVTSIHFEKSGIPVSGKGIGYFGIYYTVEGTEYLLLTLGSDVIQIYSQQVSVPDNGELYVVSNKNIPSEINEVRLNLGYGEDPTKDLLVSWTNTDDHGSLLYDRISFKLYDVTNGRNLVEQKILDLGGDRSTMMSYQFGSEMVKGRKYVVYATGRTPYGRETKTFVSNTFQAKVLVESIEIDESSINSSYLTNGESFAISATVYPEDATNKSLLWSFSDDIFDVLANDSNSNKVTLVAKKPGMTKIIATSLDNTSLSDTSEKSIAIRLRKPEIPICEVVSTDGGKKVRVSWGVNDNWAASYKVYRIVDGVKEENEVATVESVSNSANYYEDVNIIAGKSYAYIVKAENDLLATEFFNPESEMSEASSAITPIIPTISFVQPTLDNFILTVSDGTGKAEDILVTEEEPQTLFIEERIEGIEKYTWLVNGVKIKSGNYDFCSSITLTSTMDAVEIRGGDANTLTLVGETADGKAYSSTIYFRVVTVKDERVEISNSIESIDINQGRYALDAYVYPFNATMQDIRYTSDNESVASVDGKGVITLNGIGHVTITASCTYGESAKVEFDVYNPLSDPVALLRIFNAKLKTVVSQANTSFKDDWWALASRSYNYDNGQASVTAPSGTSQSAGSIEINNMVVDDSVYGPIVFNTSTPISIYASDGGGFWNQGYLGDDPLQYIGYKNEGLVMVTLPYGQVSVAIQLNSIDVQNNSGSYIVTFQGKESVNVEYSTLSGQYPLV